MSSGANLFYRTKNLILGKQRKYRLYYCTAHQSVKGYPDHVTCHPSRGLVVYSNISITLYVSAYDLNFFFFLTKKPLMIMLFTSGK